MIASAFNTIEILVFRATPYAIFVMFNRRLSERRRLVYLLLFTALLVICGNHRKGYANDFTLLVIGYGYYFQISLLVYTIQRHVYDERVRREIIFALFLFGFMLLPGRLSSMMSTASIQVIGWELVLSAYSYCVDAKKESRNIGRGECLFFLLVDPTLVFRERSRLIEQTVCVHRGALRIVLGLVVMFFGISALKVRTPVLEVILPRLPIIDSYFRITASIIWYFLGIYCTHSGLASIQIGLMRLIGYKAPERYIWPLIAKSPADFWRRWNTYVGSWFRRYVFFPLSVNWSKRKWLGVKKAKGGAIIVTFASVGLLHDVFVYADAGIVGINGLLGFVISGVAIIMWEINANIVRKIKNRRQQMYVANSYLSRLFFWCYILITLWLVKS